MKAVFIDIDNTLLDYDAYVKKSLEEGFKHFDIGKYEPYMYDVYTEENNKLWRQIEEGTLVFKELEKIRFNNVFKALNISFDGPTFETYHREALNESAIIVKHAIDMLEYLSGKYILIAASNGPYHQQIHRLQLAGMSKYFKYFFISGKVGYSKPAREFFDYAFAHIEEDILPEETCIIGDSLTSDMLGGYNYNMKTLLYKRNKDMQVSDYVDYVVEDLIDVKRYL